MSDHQLIYEQYYSKLNRRYYRESSLFGRRILIHIEITKLVRYVNKLAIQFFGDGWGVLWPEPLNEEVEP